MTEYDNAARAAGDNIDAWRGLAAGWLTRAEFAEKELQEAEMLMLRAKSMIEAMELWMPVDKRGIPPVVKDMKEWIANRVGRGSSPFWGVAHD